MSEAVKAQLEREMREMEALAKEFDRNVDAYERAAGELRADLYGRGEDDA